MTPESTRTGSRGNSRGYIDQTDVSVECHARLGATELLKCSFSRVMKALMEVGAQAKLSESWQSYRSRLYEFAEPEEPTN